MKTIVHLFLFNLILFSNNAISQHWERLPDLENITGLPVMAAANGKIYILSGTNGGTAYTHEFDPATNTWTQKAPIPQSCVWTSANTVNGKIYVLGGGQNNVKQSYNYIYDPLEDKWIQGADLLTPRMYHSSTVANDKIYILGGQNGDGTTEWFFDEYDPAKDNWSRKADMIHNGAWYCGALGVGDKIYRIAGGGAIPNLTKNHVDVYDINTNQWLELDTFHIKLHAPQALLANDRIYLLGGFSNGRYLDTIWNYDPVFFTWRASKFKLPEPRSYHEVAYLDGCIYVFGGQNTSDSTKDQLVRYCLNVNVEEFKSTISEIGLSPIPADGFISLEYALIESSAVDIYITDISGKKIQTIEKGFRSAGSYSTRLETGTLSSGVYFIAIQTEKETQFEKFVIE